MGAQARGRLAIARVKLGQGRYYEHSDLVHFLPAKIARLGSPVSITYNSGPVANRTRYTPFGLAMEDANLLKDQGGFTGHIKDSATGLNPCIFRSENCTVQARYYDPVIGRFLSIDPVTFMSSGDTNQFNRYSYASNDPINRFDPDGNDDIFVGGQGDSGLFASKIVKRYSENWARSRPDRTTSYRAMRNQGGIVKDLKRAAASGGPVNVACHSRGCAHAMSAIAKSGVQIDNLVTVDPVNVGAIGIQLFNGERPDNISNWTNVEGTPKTENLNGSDTIEGMGEAISGQFNTSGADTQIATERNHGNFPEMFESSSNSASSGSSRFDSGYTVTGSRIRKYD